MITPTTPIKFYAGNGSTTAFPTVFEFIEAADLVVVLVNDATGVGVTQTITTHYTVAGGSYSNGTVTMLTAPATGETLVIYANDDVEQILNLVGDTYHAGVLEQGRDKTIMALKQVKRDVDRAVKVDITDQTAAPSATTIIAAADVINTYGILVINEGGFEITIDGQGSPLTTGAKKIYGSAPFAGTIDYVRVLADTTGSVVIDIWKTNYSDYDAGATHPVVGDSITASAKPTISAGVKDEDSTLTGWTKTFAKGDIFEINIDSVSTITKLVISLRVTKTA